MEKNEKNTKNSKFKIFILLLVVVLSVLLIAFIVISPYVVAKTYYENEAKKRMDVDGDKVFKNSQSSIAYDKDGKEIVIFKSNVDKYYVYSENMTDVVKYAFIMLADRNFYESDGASDKDLYAIAKDDRLAQGTVEGISPITRQIARDMFLSYDLEKDNSVIEVFVANELEKRYTKAQLFEYYINNLYFGNGYYGIETAARGYFNCELSDLNVAEVAFLAAVADDIQLSPYNNAEMESILIKRNEIVSRMYDDKVITDAQYFSGISNDIELEKRTIVTDDYVKSYITDCVVKTLMAQDGFVFRTSFDSVAARENYEKEYSKAYTNHYAALYKEGYRIYTSFDMSLQGKMQIIIDSAVSSNKTISAQGTYALQGSGVCIDNETGRVVAIVGGRTSTSSEHVINRAFETYTIAGKVITPLNVYTPFIEWHHNPNYIVYQEEAVDGTFINKVTLREAILKYSDDFATKVYGKITPGYALSVLDRIGFEKAFMAPVTNEGHSSISTNVLELAAGYRTLENDGTYKKATCIIRITDTKGDDIYVDSTNGVNAYAANDSRIMTEILATNISEGYLKAYKTDEAITAAMASGDEKGNFFVGYSSYYTFATYVGFEGLTQDEIKAQKIDTYSMSGNVWKEFMSDVHKGKELVEFPEGGPYSTEENPEEEILQPTTEQPSLGGVGGHPGDGDDYVGGYSY